LTEPTSFGARAVSVGDRHEKWHTDPAFRTRVLEEWDKIEPYKAMGWIAEWPA
jgi:hypothetical protein